VQRAGMANTTIVISGGHSFRYRRYGS